MLHGSVAGLSHALTRLRRGGFGLPSMFRQCLGAAAGCKGGDESGLT